VELPDLNEESDLYGYIEEEDEDFEFSESEYQSYSSSSDNEDEEQLDKNGKRGEFGGTSDEEENDEEVDKTILNTLDLTSKTLASKKHKVIQLLQQQSKIVRLSKSARNLLNVVIDSHSDNDVEEGNTVLFQNYFNIFSK